jgi:hypothetical protein
MYSYDNASRISYWSFSSKKFDDHEIFAQYTCSTGAMLRVVSSLGLVREDDTNIVSDVWIKPDGKWERLPPSLRHDAEFYFEKGSEYSNDCFGYVAAFYTNGYMYISGRGSRQYLVKALEPKANTH